MRPRSRRHVEASGSSVEETLIGWLQEVYLALEMDGWLTRAVEAVEASAERVRGTLLGEPLDPARHTVHTEIKAITYHDLQIRRDSDGLLRTTLIIDV